MSDPTPIPIVDVPRNDLEQAEAFYESHGSQITADECEMLFMLQDDPAAFEELSREWLVVDEPTVLDA